MNKIVVVLGLFLGVLYQCAIQKKTTVAVAKFPPTHYDFSKNPSSDAIIFLGRNLFYDPILSADNTISCASCHSSFNAFAHTDHDLSHGINDQIGNRNAPALFNLAWQSTFMWDGAIHHLDVQALAPISHPKEMGSSLQEVIKKLENSGKYKALFFKAYQDSLISTERIFKSLAQFQLSLISMNSKYDSVMRKQAKFTEQENAGYQLFQKNCNSCHKEPLFSDYSFKNNGLAVDPTLDDWGRYGITKQASDSLLFKVPSLRNLSYSYPYMHDGRFKTLRQVLNHYVNEIVKHPTLSKELIQGVELSSNEKVDLIAFLLTLNDKSFVFNPAFSFPKEE